jgi:hypothetical protein
MNVIINWQVSKEVKVNTSETSVYFHETTRRNIPQVCNLHTRRRETWNLCFVWLTLSYNYKFGDIFHRKLHSVTTIIEYATIKQPDTWKFNKHMRLRLFF